MHNRVLAEKLGISFDNRVLIDMGHAKLYHITTMPHRYTDPVGEIEHWEYKLQELWGFEQSSAYHTWWLDIRGCTCPKMDNAEVFGIDQRVYSSDCPWHGDISVGGEK